MKKYLTFLVLIAILSVGYFHISKDEPTITLGAEYKIAVDVIGTQVGTSTTGVLFNGLYTATTTYPILISGAKDQAIFSLKATAASSTPSGGVQLSFLGSNDVDCTTATTSPDVGNPVLVQDINWFDIGDHVANLSGTQSLTGTSTFTWLPTVAQGTDIVLTNLQYECIAIQVSASSTSLFMQVRTK